MSNQESDFFVQSGVYILVIDLSSFEIKYGGDDFFKFFGLKYDEVIGKKITQLKIFENSNELLLVLSEINKNNSIKYFKDTVINPKTNESFDIKASVYNMSDNTGIILFKRFFQDGKNILSEQAALSMGVLGMGLWFIDLATFNFECNISCPLYPVHHRYFNDYTFSEYKNIVHPDDYPSFNSEITNYVAEYSSDNKELFQGEYRVKGEKNTWEWVLFTGKILPDAEGKPKTMIAIHQVVTKKKHFEDSFLRKAKVLDLLADFSQHYLVPEQNVKKYLSLILEKTGRTLDSDSVYLFKNLKIDEDDVITGVFELWYKYPEKSSKIKLDIHNISFRQEQLMHWSKKLSQGEIIDSLTASSDNQLLRNNELSFIKKLNINQLVLIPVFVHGKWWGTLLLEYYYNPRLWSQDEKGAVKTLASAIGEAVYREEQTHYMKVEETNLFKTSRREALGALAGGIAHDLNNILSPILGFSSLMLEEMKPDERFYEDVSVIYDAANKAKDMISKLLSFGKSEESEFKNIELNDFLESFYNMARHLVREEIEIRYELSNEDLVVYADSTQLSQVVINLIINAQEAIETNGTITISTAFVDAEHENIAGLKSKHYALLKVSDDGVGMTSQELEHIFETFFTTKSFGTGLGLSTVKGIMNKHNGIIDVKSVKGKGSSFYIYFPMDKQQSVYPVHKTGKRRSTGEHPHYRILLVEDDISVLRIVDKILKRKGYKVISYEKSKEALEAVRAGEIDFDLVLSDVVMPVVNGKDLVDEILKIKPDCKYIFMSGHTDNIVDKHGIYTKEINFIHKPFTIEELNDLISEVLNS